MDILLIKISYLEIYKLCFASLIYACIVRLYS